MTKVIYTAPGLLLADIEALIAAATGLAVATAGELTIIDQAITDVGLAVATWEGNNWWWLHEETTFKTVDETQEYNLHTVNAAGAETGTAVSAGLWAITSAYYDDDWPLKQITKKQYDRNNILLATQADAKPYQYAIWSESHATASGEDPHIGFWPTPDGAYSINYAYVKQHSKITSALSLDTALIIPAAYHRDFYVNSAIWLIRHSEVDPGPLKDCPSFMEGIRKMVMGDPTKYDRFSTNNEFPDVQGGYPHDRRVIDTAGGRLIEDTSGY